MLPIVVVGRFLPQAGSIVNVQLADDAGPQIRLQLEVECFRLGEHVATSEKMGTPEAESLASLYTLLSDSMQLSPN